MKASNNAATMLRHLSVALMAGIVCWAGGNLHAGATRVQDTVRTILLTLDYTEKLVQNIRIKAELDDWTVAGAAAGLPLDEDRHVREYATFIFDNNRRMRHELETHQYTPSGTLKWDRHRHVRTFSRTSAMTLDEFEDESHKVLRSASIANLDQRRWSGRTPLDYCGGLGQKISERIRNALDKGYPMELATESGAESELYVLTVSSDNNPEGYKYKFWLDPTKLFYATKIESYYNGRLIKRLSSIPEEITSDIWVPRSGEWVDYSGDAENTMSGRTLMTVKEVEVNMDVLPDSVFEIKLLPGTKVGDTRSGVPLSYYVGVGPVANALLDKIVDDIVQGTFASDNQRIPYDTLRAKDGLSVQHSVIEPNVVVSSDFSAVAGPTGPVEHSMSNRVGVFALLTTVLVALGAMLWYFHRLTSQRK